MHYEDEPRIFSVGAYPAIQQDALLDYPYDVILSPRFGVWGWGTWRDRWSIVQDKLLNFRHPFSTLDDIPQRAGLDFPMMAKESLSYSGEYFWTGSALALLSLYYDWRHAISRNYLIENIGHNTGQHKSNHTIDYDIAYFEKHNAVEDYPLEKIPPFDVDQTIDQAVQDFIRGLYQAKSLDVRATKRARQPFYRRICLNLWYRMKQI